MVVALFQNEDQAQQAVDALLNAGFSSDQISFAGHGTPGGMLAGLKSFFTGEAMSVGSAYNDLVSKGMPEQDAQYYQQQFDAGRSVVAVTGTDRLDEASTILSTYGGYGTGQRSAGYGTQTDTGYSTQQPMTGTEGEQRMQLREEQLQVYKQPVETGQVGLRKEVVSEQQSVDVPVTHEEVYIERRPGSGQPSDAPIGEGETFRVPVREEQVGVNKQQVVREEVALGKRQVQDTQHVTDTVRREEARVERQGDVNIQGQDVDLDTDQQGS
jgi:uncharacterized protein (TIGR02271 family)